MLAGWLSLVKLQTEVSQGCTHLKAQLGLEEPLLKWLSNGWWLLAAASVSPPMGHSTELLECPYDMEACFGEDITHLPLSLDAI